MKAQKPTIPKGAPEGTVWFGGPIEWFKITLRVSGANLIPDVITQILGCKPDQETEKGKPVYGEAGTTKRIARHGGWHLILNPGDTDEWDCSEAVMELLHRLPSDLDTWRLIASRYEVDIFIGLEMISANKGFSLSPQVMQYLGERGIEIGFDIYYKPDNKS